MTRLTEEEIAGAASEVRLAAALRAAYAELDALTEAARWRLPEVAMPEQHVMVDITYQREDRPSITAVSWWDKRDGWVCHYSGGNEFDDSRVLAWRPRPEPYSPEEPK